MLFRSLPVSSPHPSMASLDPSPLLVSQSPPPTGTFRLLDLPVDIKRRLVHISHETDLSYKFRLSGKLAERKHKTEALESEQWYGKSTHALFLVNRELSELAAPYVFKVS
jgi:hypothetical protein